MTTLTCADNGLDDVTPLAPLWALRTLDLRNNQLQSCDALAPVLGSAMALRELQVQGNPGLSPAGAPARAKVRDHIILMAGQRLQQLDGDEVTDTQRHFIYARDMKRRGVPIPGLGGGRAAQRGRSQGSVHHPTGNRDVRGVAGGGWRGSKGHPGAGTQAAHAMGAASSVPSFAPAAAAAVPGGRPMPKEGVQRQAAGAGSARGHAASSTSDLQGLTLSGVSHSKLSGRK